MELSGASCMDVLAAYSVVTFSAHIQSLYICICNLTFAGTCSIITLVFIAYDRYHVIVYGIAHASQRITARKAVLIISFIWIYSVVACIPPFFGWGGYKLGTVYNKSLFRDVYG